MAKYLTDFRNDAIGQKPSYMTYRWRTAGLLGTVEQPDDYESKVLRLIHSAGTRGLLSWDAVDSDPHRETVELVAKMRILGTTVGSQGPSLAARCSGAASNEVGIVGGPLASTGSTLNMRLGVFTTSYVITLAGFAWVPGEWYFCRLKCQGTEVKLKRWQAAEPSGWQIEATDSGVSGAGWTGIYMGPNTPAEVAFFGIGTGGDAAPMPETEIPSVAKPRILSPHAVGYF